MGLHCGQRKKAQCNHAESPKSESRSFDTSLPETQLFSVGDRGFVSSRCELKSE